MNILYPWQQEQWQQLQQCRHAQRLPHALLLSGAAGLGKTAFADTLAASLLCFNPNTNGYACGECKACLLFKAKSHPDFRPVTPPEVGKPIPIDNIRAVIQYSTLTAQYNQQQVILVNPAEAMNINAANSLLKLLEEPPTDTIILLVSHSPAHLLPTIRSRCQCINFQPPHVEHGVQWLIMQQVEAAQAGLLLKLTDYAPLAALALLQEDTLAQREQLLSNLAQLISGQHEPLQIAESWQKQDTTQLLTWMMDWTMDLIRYALTQQVQFLTNQDQLETLQRVSKRLTLDHLFKILAMQQETYRLINSPSNVKVQGLLDDLAVTWMRLGKVKPS